MYIYLGIDIGTTGVKAALFDEKGSLCGSGLAEYTLEKPSPDIVELDPEIYWLSVKEAVAKALGKSGFSPENIRAFSITGQAETLIFTDAKGNPVRKGIVWLDNRAAEEAGEMEKVFTSERLFRLSGQTEMLPCWPAPKILHVKRHEKEVFAKTAKFLMVEDFIFHKLTGKFATCRGLMPSSLYYDITTGDYVPEILDYLGITRSQLPELAEAGEKIACTIENDSLIPAGIPGGIAPIDHVCGNLGSGCFEEGMISETTGCSLAVCATFPGIIYDEEKRISTYHGFKKGSGVLLPWAPTAGMLLKHFRDEFAGNLNYKELDEAAGNIPAGSEGLILLPHCAGAISPVCNPHARGTAWGVTLAHTKGHWARSIMESIGCLLRSNIEILEALGLQVKELRSLGGGSLSPLWLQIKADILQTPVTVPAWGSEATALGCAILAAASCGDFSTPEEGAKALVHTERTVYPGKDAAIYQEIYQQYKALDKLLMPTYKG